MTLGSKSHREDLGWLSHRIHVDTAISIRYANTPEQIADISTKGSCTKFIWSQLPALVRFDITGHMCTLTVVCGPPFCDFFALDMSMPMANDFAEEQPVSAKGKPRRQLLRSRPRSDCKVLWEIKLIKLLRWRRKKSTKSEPTVVQTEEESAGTPVSSGKQYIR